ncbi:MAG: thioredoxin family protein [Phycisphaerales bacterium]
MTPIDSPTSGSSTGAAHRLDAAFLRSKFDLALPYGRYLETDPSRAAAWRSFERHVSLSDGQRRLLAQFTRTMPVLVVSGIWCGDCVQQGPIIQRIAEAGPRIDLRWLDRDEHLDLAGQVRICGGLRVPTAIFMSEDFEPVSVFGDRTLSRYRAMAQRTLGAACPVPNAPLAADEVAATTQDWLDEFERVNWILRLSARLREKHGD